MKTSEIVEAILQKHPRTRNSDTDLIIGVLHVKGLILTPEQREILKEAHIDSITRERRKFQEQGMYLPTDPQVRKKRRIKELEIEQVAPSLSPVKLFDRIAEPV